MWCPWVKVKLSLGLINSALCHIDVEGTGSMVPPFLTWELDGGEWSASQLFHFSPRETAPIIHCAEGWVSPRETLDVIEKKKSLSPTGNWLSNSSAVH
jgi:hypothetical protein